MNPDAPDSFDGRYFGVLGMTDVIRRAPPVWTDEEGSGHYVCFADVQTADRRNPIQPVNQGE